MSDRLALATAIEDAGIERAKAVRIASVIWDAIHDNVATKSDLEAVRADLKADIAALRRDLLGTELSLKADVAAVRVDLEATERSLKAQIDLVEHRLLTRLGGLAVVLAGLLFTALHLWPAH
jgi:hypothetical protein